MATDTTNNRFKMSEGDWICCDPHCANINFARRSKCNRCHKERTDGVGKKKLGQEIGKALADKSRGLFSADDWQCNKCGNVNWARRQQCNMCNAPKFGEIEERTGYGGGYNDRGVVEYIKRDDSDSEYDEFGRKKRKKSNIKNEEGVNNCSEGNSKEYTENSVRGDVSHEEDEEDDSHRNEEEPEEEEDDEDEDDGDDLSKYDLSGWGDESSVSQSERDICKRQYSNAQSRDRSRSRSRSRSPAEKK